MFSRHLKPRHPQRRAALVSAACAAITALTLGVVLVAHPDGALLAPTSTNPNSALTDAPAAVPSAPNASATVADSAESASSAATNVAGVNADGSYYDGEGNLVVDEKIVGDVIVTADPGEALPEEGSTLAGATVKDVQIVADAGDETTAKISLSDVDATDAAMAELEESGLEAQPNFVYHLLEDVETPLTAEEAAAAGVDVDANAATSDANASVQYVTNDPANANDKLYHLYPYKTTTSYAGANVSAAWDIGRANHRVTVATIDTGCYADHPDLKGNIVTDLMTDVYYNPTNPTPGKITDVHGHGTHVAGIIAGVADNAVGGAGTSYNAKVLPIKVFDSNGSGSTSTSKMVAAYDYLDQCIKDEKLTDLKVINMSVGGYGTQGADDKALEEKINHFRDDYKVLTVCAGGNGDSLGRPYTIASYPSDYEACLSVTALSKSGDDMYWSDYNEAKDISAPGEEIYSTYNDGGYAMLNGTSMASPLVAGIAATMFAEVDGLTPEECIQYITTNVNEIPSTGNHAVRAGVTGSAGAIDAEKALRAAMVGEHVVAEDHFITEADVHVDVEPRVHYEHEYIRPPVTVTVNGQRLTQDTDYEVAYSKNLKPGIATVSVKGINDYRGYVDTHFEIWIANDERISLGEDNTDIIIENMPKEYTFNNVYFEPQPTVKQQNELLILDEDYTLSYENNKDATHGSPATVTITGIGVYTGTRTLTFDIAQAKGSMNLDSQVHHEKIELVGGGDPYDEHIFCSPTMKFTVKSEDPGVAEAKVVSEYQNLIKVVYNTIHIEPKGEGETTVTLGIDPEGNYKPGQTIKITVKVRDPNRDLSNATIAAVPDQEYKPGGVKPKPEVTLGETKLQEGKDFTYSWSFFDRAGTAYVYAKGMGGYTGETHRSYVILPAKATLNLGATQLDLNAGDSRTIDVTYKGTNSLPIVDVSNTSPNVAEVSLAEAYPTSRLTVNAKSEGTAIITLNVSPWGNYSGAEAKLAVVVGGQTVHVSQVDIEPSTVTMKAGDTRQLTAKITPANAIEQDVTWKISGDGIATIDSTGKLTASKPGNTSVTAEVGGKSATCQVKIEENTDQAKKGDISGALVFDVQPSYPYTGHAINPTPEIWLNGHELQKSADYTLSYAENTNAGTGYIYARGANGYTGERVISFEITPAKTTLTATKGWTGNLKVGASGTITVSGASTQLAAKSSATGVATVKAQGTSSVTVTPIAAGDATITITCPADQNHESGSTTVEVHVEAATTPGGTTPGGSGGGSSSGGSSGSSSGSSGSGSGGTGSSTTPTPGGTSTPEPPKGEESDAGQMREEVVAPSTIEDINKASGTVAEVSAAPSTSSGSDEDSGDVTWTVAIADEEAPVEKVSDGPVKGIVTALQSSKAETVQLVGNAQISITLTGASSRDIEAFCERCVNEALAKAVRTQAATGHTASELANASFQLAITCADGSTATHTVRFTAPTTDPHANEVAVHRYYNKWSGAHLFTADEEECKDLEKAGWIFEHIGWYAPKSGEPVYRLYNPYNFDHYYTKGYGEAKDLVDNHGWRWDFKGEPAFYSVDATRAKSAAYPIYQLFNHYVTEGTHHWTTDYSDEYLPRITDGWEGEGEKFYASSLPEKTDK